MNKPSPGDSLRNLGGFEVPLLKVSRRLNGPYIATMFAILGFGSWILFLAVALWLAYAALIQFEARRPLEATVILLVALPLAAWDVRILPLIVRLIVKTWRRIPLT